MDTENKGQLDINAVYALMQDFQQEQRKALTLKWVVIALAGFAVLLCLANIGTSFAAATLAKDITTSPEGLIVSTRDGGMIATGNMEEIIDLDVADGTSSLPRTANATDRLLWSRGLQVPKFNVGNDGNGNFQISQDKMNKVMRKFCSSWDSIQNYNCNGLRGCGWGSTRVRLMYGCGQSELTLSGVPKCIDANTWEFKLTSKVVSQTADLQQQCRTEFGSNAIVADWKYDILSLSTQQVKKQLLNRLGIKETYDEMHYFVTYNGRFSPSNSNDNNNKPIYFFEYLGSNSPPLDWTVHDQYDGLTLSSGLKNGGRVLCWAENTYMEVQIDLITNRGDLWAIDCNGDEASKRHNVCACWWWWIARHTAPFSHNKSPASSCSALSCNWTYLLRHRPHTCISYLFAVWTLKVLHGF